MSELIDRGLRFFEHRTSRRNAQLLVRLGFGLVALIVVYSAVFHLLMWMEGQRHSALTGVYWTLTTMSTLGLGDVAFFSDTGRMFTVLVLVSGLSFILVFFPFLFIQLFQSTARVHRELPGATRGHVILTHYGPVSLALIRKVRQFRSPYVLIVPDITEAMQLTDAGLRVVTGELDDPETYRQVRIEHAMLVAATGTDVTNTAVTYVVRQVSRTIPIIATATTQSTDQVLRAAGATHVLKLDEMMGWSLARRTTAGDALAHVIGEFDRLTIAEATTAGTPLVGKTLQDAKLRELTGVTVVGVWERGHFSTATAETVISARTVLVLAGTHEQIQAYNEMFCIYNVTAGPVVILGGGNVGQAMSRALEVRDLDYRVVERRPERAHDERTIVGDAADIEVLHSSSIMDAPSVAITTHNDDVNIYLTTLIRHLRPDIQIISRATLERAVHILHDAGADFVMSYASMGANSIFNMLHSGDILMVAEGVDVFRVKAPAVLAGKTIADSLVRPDTGCSIIGIETDGDVRLNPEPAAVLPAGSHLILIGTVESEKKFLDAYGTDQPGAAADEDGKSNRLRAFRRAGTIRRAGTVRRTLQRK